MRTTLHVFKDDAHIAAFDLSPGAHLLGIGLDADLVLGDDRVSNDVCYVDVDHQGQVVVRALPTVDLQLASGEVVAKTVMINGQHVLSAGLTLTLLRRPDSNDVQVDAPRTSAVTERNEMIHAPPADTLAMLVTTAKGSKAYEIDQPSFVIGREDGCNVRIFHDQVSARHAEVIQTAKGVWLKDLGSTNGTFLNGALFSSGAFPRRGRVHLSAAPDAPVIELLTRAEAMARKDASSSLLHIVGSSEPMQICREQIVRFGPMQKPVLILGETGVGKELIARGLAQTRGANLPFIAFNCGDVDPHLVGDALFGHVKGAFTGATADTPGRFEAAGKGTIFIDELGELPKDQQARLLRVIQNSAIQRRGANEETPIHCRIVLATHRNLEQQVTGGAFREDLFYRVTPLQIWVPPLRDRLADLPELALTILARLSSDGEAKILSPGAMQRLGEHHWPGNVRELENVLTRAAVKRHGMEIPAEDLEFGFGPPGAMAAKQEAQTLARTLERQRLAERVLLQKALDDAGGNVREAARTLGKSNTSLRRRMRQLGMLTTPEALLE